MTLADGFARQLAHPRGLAGRLLGEAMDLANRKPTRLALDLLGAQAGEAILDAGCGTGAAMASLLRRTPCSVTGIDPSGTMLAKASKKLGHRARLYRASLRSLPFADGAFDAALALNVLYFTDEQGQMLGELRRVLRPGGRLVAYVTHRETMRDWPIAKAGLHRLFDGEELERTLVAGGFDPERICVQQCRVTRSVKGLLVQAER